MNYSDGQYFCQQIWEGTNMRLLLNIDCYSDPTAPLSSRSAGPPPGYLQLVSCIGYVDILTIILNNRVGETPPSQPVPDDGHGTPLASHYRLRKDTRVPQHGAVCELVMLALWPESVRNMEIVGLESFLPTTRLRTYFSSLRAAVKAEAQDEEPEASYFFRAPKLDSMVVLTISEQYEEEAESHVIYRIETVR